MCPRAPELPVLQPSLGSSLILLIDRLCSNDHCERADQDHWLLLEVYRLHRLACPSLSLWATVPTEVVVHELPRTNLKSISNKDQQTATVRASNTWFERKWLEP